MNDLDPVGLGTAEYEPNYQDIGIVEEYVNERLLQLQSALLQANLLEVGIIVAQIRRTISNLELLHISNEVVTNYLQIASEDLGFIGNPEANSKNRDENKDPRSHLKHAFAHLKAIDYTISAALTEIRQPGGWQS